MSEIKRVRGGFLCVIRDRGGRKVPDLCLAFATEKEARAYLDLVG